MPNSEIHYLEPVLEAFEPVSENEFGFDLHPVFHAAAQRAVAEIIQAGGELAMEEDFPSDEDASNEDIEYGEDKDPGVKLSQPVRSYICQGDKDSIDKMRAFVRKVTAH